MIDAPRKENTFLQGRYRIVRRLGHGGMGTVYEAVDERLANTVALKETHFSDERLRRQFENEARLLARLRYPSLPKVFDHFVEDGGQFLVMEFIPGHDLGELLQKRGKPFTPEDVIAWADQLLGALAYLHTQEPPVVHRDIKPQNLKLTGGNQIILLDFGLAKGADAATGSTPRSVLGATISYAPLEQILQVDQNQRDLLASEHPRAVEQALQNGTDARSDLYSLGATLVHLLTGKLPTSSPVRAMSVWQGLPDPLHRLLDGQFSTPLVELLQRATALGSDDRYGSAREMRARLREIIASQELTQIDVPQPPPRGDEGGPGEPSGLVSDDAGPVGTPAPRVGWLRRMRQLPGKLFTKENMGAWIAAAATLVAAVPTFITLVRQREPPEVEYAGRVSDGAGNPVSGATVTIRDEQGNVQVRKTDSVGKYKYFMKPTMRSAHFTVTADNYDPYERDLPPTQTGREEFFLTASQPTPTPTATPGPSPTATPAPTPAAITKPPKRATPCSAKDVLLGKC